MGVTARDSLPRGPWDCLPRGPWDGLPRVPLAALPTPLTRARRLEARLGGSKACPPILVKRDDLTGFGAAGHKARQLEFLIGAALDQGCDVLVTGGGPGSNWCPAAAVAAAVTGLDCELVSYGSRPDHAHPNLAASLAAGARVRFTGDPDRAHLESAIEARAAELQAAGRRPFAIPRGGANALGTVGMAVAAHELAGQLDTAPEAVVMATGSGGGYAGLLLGSTWPVVGASVSRTIAETTAQVTHLVDGAAALLALPRPAPDAVRLVDMRGPGFGVPSEEGEAAARTTFQAEGLLLDPVYTAKAFALLLRLIDQGTGPVVFWHSGGVLAAADHLARAGAADVGARA